MNILVSACLLGENCKYNGGNNLADGLREALTAKGVGVMAFCPECAGGLPTPRVPSERLGDRVVSKEGADVTAAFFTGAAGALGVAKAFGCRYAILKKNSPSCGHGTIYDGSFTGTLAEGDGVTAEMLLKEGIAVYNEENWQELLNII